MAAMTVENWVDRQQSHGRYSFLREQAVAGSGLSPEAVKKALQRLARRGRVLKVKDYFYVIVPLEYQSSGSPPVSWFINDLMAAMKQPYHVGLLTAAAQHGDFSPTAAGIPGHYRQVRPAAFGRSHEDSLLCKQVRRQGPNRRDQDAHWQTCVLPRPKPLPWTWSASYGPQATWVMWLP